MRVTEVRSVRMRVVLIRAMLGWLAWAWAGPALALVMAVNEGVTYRVGDDARARYAAIAADLSKLLGQPVTVEPVPHYPTLQQGLKEQRWDLALVHPAHHAMRALGGGWKLVASAKGWQGYKASFLVRADSPLKSMADLRGLRLGAPDEDSITAWMVRATLRDALGTADSVKLTYTRYQDAVSYFVETGLTHAGATAASAVVKDWRAKGGRVLAESRPVPIKHLIAAPSVTAAQLQTLRAYFTGLDGSEEGRRKLEPTKLQGFVAGDEAQLLQLGRWLGL